MATCFVIQPFDRGKFDGRYRDIFKPAIEAAGFEAYRVDEDPAVSIPIEHIEKGIREAAVCFADITDNNPNVLFELGYAIACDKELAIVRERNARQKFPFDIRHRAIILYDTGTSSDYTTLGGKITNRLKAIDKKEVALDKLAKESPLTETMGLSVYERIVIATIVGNSFGTGESIGEYFIRKEARRSGLTDVAVVLALRKLLQKLLIQRFVGDSFNEPEYFVYSLTDQGWQWVLDNESQFVLQRPEAEPEGNDIPF